MKSKTIKQFVKMQSKEHNMIELSKYKRELPEEYAYFNGIYKKALEDVQSAHNRHVPGYTSFDYQKEENILKSIDNSIPMDKTYEEMYGPHSETPDTRARDERIKNGTFSHEDFRSYVKDKGLIK